MIVIVEGVDGLGKTTLARRLEAKFGFTYFKSSVNPMNDGADNRPGQISDYNVAKLALATGKDIVFDRFFPSQMVYDSYYERPLDEEMIWKLDEMFGYEALAIMLFADDEHDFRPQADDAVPTADLRELQALFFDFAKRSKMTWRSINAGKTENDLFECVSLLITDRRPSKDETYMNLAREVSRRSTCLSRRNGAVLVSEHGHVIATGYNGAPCNIDHPRECKRLQAGTLKGAALDLCMDVHSEENLLAQAASQGASTRLSTCYTMASPCARCARMLINAGIEEVVYSELYGDPSGVELLKQAKIEVRQIA